MGPLPPPDVLHGYEQALPGAADRIIRMAEAEQTHRHSINHSQLKTGTGIVFAGQIMAFAIMASGILVGGYLSLNGCNLTGMTYFLASLGTLAGLFIYTQKRKPPAKSDAGPKSG